MLDRATHRARIPHGARIGCMAAGVLLALLAGLLAARSAAWAVGIGTAVAVFSSVVAVSAFRPTGQESSDS